MAPGDGSLRELAVVEEDRVMTLDTDLDDLGVALLGLSAIAAHGALRRGRFEPDDRVVVLGAGGVVGQVAVALAADWGASSVVAVTRGATSAARARELGATAAIDLEHLDAEGLTRALGDALPDGVTLCVDPVWGAPAAGVLAAMARGGRLVNLGDAAGPTVPLASALVRSRSLDVLGYTNVAQTWDAQVDALGAVLAVADRTGLRPTAQVVSPDRLPVAWAAYASGAVRARVVVDFTT
jgi:NADPH:quinone reductase-like Zn-dependent oxidoreductase